MMRSSSAMPLREVVAWKRWPQRYATRPASSTSPAMHVILVTCQTGLERRIYDPKSADAEHRVAVRGGRDESESGRRTSLQGDEDRSDKTCESDYVICLWRPDDR